MRQRAQYKSSGFTLLEVMIAIAILGVAMALLLEMQSQSIEWATRARNITIGTQLARAKLYDCEQELMKNGFSISDFDQEGTFEDDKHPEFTWECHAYQPDMPVPTAGGDASSALSAAGVDPADAPQQPAGAEMGMQMLQPILGQMSTVIGQSIRELVVIVHWGQGIDADEIRVVTHVIDPAPVQAIARILSEQMPPTGNNNSSNNNNNSSSNNSSSNSNNNSNSKFNPLLPGVPVPGANKGGNK